MTTYSASLPKYRGRKTFRNGLAYLGAGPTENRVWVKDNVSGLLSAIYTGNVLLFTAP